MRSHHKAQAQKTYYFVTTMDGTPVLNEKGDILQFISTESVRQGARDRTFKSGQRHHSRGVDKDRWFRIRKIRKKTGLIPLGLAQG